MDSLPSDLPGKPKNIGVGSLSVFQGIFPTQELNRDLLHCRWILYQLSYQGSPIIHTYMYPHRYGAPQVAQWVKNLPALQEKQKTQVEVSIPGLRRSPGRGMATIPVFLPGESHGQRSLVGYSPWCRKESDMTEVAEHT